MPVPPVTDVAVPSGVTAVSSWLVSDEDEPDASSTPMTVRADPLTVTVWPTAEPPAANSSLAVSGPSTTTGAPDATSAAV